MNINPLLSAREEIQHLSWPHLKDGKTYHFELLIPLRAPTRDYREGGYCIFPTQAIADSPTLEVKFCRGDFLIIDIPTKTFEQAYLALPYPFRRDITEEHNLRLKFLRKSKQRMFLLEWEIMKPAEEQLLFAQKVILKKGKIYPKKTAAEEY